MSDLTQIEQVLLYVLTSILSGGFSALMTVAILKNDVKWIKETLNNHAKRLYYLERKKVLC